MDSPSFIYMTKKLGEFETHAALTQQFEHHGLRCLAPISGRSWWTDRVWPPFDAAVSPERFLLDGVVPWVADQLACRPAATRGFLGVHGRAGGAEVFLQAPEPLPHLCGDRTTIDYHRSMEAGDPTLRAELYRDSEQARQDAGHAHIHPLNWPRHQWFSGDPADYLHSNRRRPAADEALLAWRAVRGRSRNDRRRRSDVTSSGWPTALQLHRGSARTRTAAHAVNCPAILAGCDRRPRSMRTVQDGRAICRFPASD